MSLAQRRTAAEGIDFLPEYSVQGSRNSSVRNGSTCDGSIRVSGDNANDDDRRDSDGTLCPAKNDQIWQTINYDPFGKKPLQHYESFPPEVTENKAAYEASSAKRAGKS